MALNVKIRIQFSRTEIQSTEIISDSIFEWGGGHLRPHDVIGERVVYKTMRVCSVYNSVQLICN